MDAVSAASSYWPEFRLNAGLLLCTIMQLLLCGDLLWAVHNYSKDCRDNATWCSKTWFLRDWAACLYTALACYVVRRSIPGTFCVCMCIYNGQGWVLLFIRSDGMTSLTNYVVVVVTRLTQIIPISNSFITVSWSSRLIGWFACFLLSLLLCV